MMRYVGTSVLLAYLTRAAKSERAEAFMRSPGLRLCVSSWVESELLSALGLKIRTGQLGRELAAAVYCVYRLDVVPHLRQCGVEDADQRNAARLLAGWTTSLRADDALHLAIATGQGAVVCTLDRGMAEAARGLGVKAMLLD
ncbi:MAG: type II toxin-antitoxin system VapC family toxin [Proteobacteria bacterium]|nr:type II toxin-antitoxin system VapC family toxin [Pseudomonadota bacterium]MBS0553782.1 type II toxin-antitoxin system VapC family toxin [Pseudomonadota bacterium]